MQMNDGTTQDESDFIVLEEGRRLSKSLLWELQERTYIQFGVKAWTEKGVPFYLTSNPLTAKQYAHMVLGYLRDCYRKDAATPFDLSFPLYLFDLGAGSGRFAYLFLKTFFRLIQGLPFEKVSIKYVMTDIVADNMEFWEKHPQLQPYILDGIVDFAFYHHSSLEPLILKRSRQQITEKEFINPPILIANYFFDTIPQDLFRVRNGHLQEGKITLKVDKSVLKSDQPTDPQLIANLQYAYDFEPIVETESYYQEPELNHLLKKYQKNFNESTFLFPIGAFETIRYFSKLSHDRLLLLAGDQGVATPAQVRHWGEPKIAKHGSFSMPVDYHVMAHYFQNRGGVGFLTTFPDPVFITFAAILGEDQEFYPETHLAFREEIDNFENKDYWKFVQFYEEKKEISLELILLLTKLGNYDPAIFYLFFNEIRRQIPIASEALKENLLLSIPKVDEMFYFLGPQGGEFILNLGVLCFDLKEYDRALFYFEKSLHITGEKKQTRQNMGACYLALHHLVKARECFQKAKMLNL